MIRFFLTLAIATVCSKSYANEQSALATLLEHAAQAAIIDQNQNTYPLPALDVVANALRIEKGQNIQITSHCTPLERSNRIKMQKCEVTFSKSVNGYSLGATFFQFIRNIEAPHGKIVGKIRVAQTRR